VDELKGEMNKIKPLTFDEDHKKDEYAKTWILGMRKYFNCKTILLMQREEFPSTKLKERNPYGGIS
jgi:hypothetical protein